MNPGALVAVANALLVAPPSPPRRNEYGKYLAYDPDATRDEARRVESFLREVVK